MTKNNLFIILAIFTCAILLSSCKKKEEPEQTFIPPPQQENSADIEKQKKEKEEFDRLKQEELNKTKGTTTDTSTTKKDVVTDTSKTKTKDVKKDTKKKYTEKEKELNTKFGNPKTAIKDYLEFIKRGTSGDGSFEKNMKNANEVWNSSSPDKFKSNYKNTKKFVVVTEPELVSQNGNNAVVKVKIKKVDKVKDKDVESDLTVTYNMVADKDGKWKIKSNTVKKN